MKIALDFDNTFSVDPELWLHFVNMARLRGHEVKIVTSRHPGNSPPFPFPQFGLEVIHCSFTAKRKHYQADVWIDDDPARVDIDHVHPVV